MSVEQYSLCLKTLANDLRLQTLRELEKRSYSVQELCGVLGAEQSKVSHSLQQLRTCNYVEVKTVGKQRIYSLRPEARQGLHLQSEKGHLFDYLDHHMKACCNGTCSKRNGLVVLE